MSGSNRLRHGLLIGIGATVTRRPLPHHRAYGSVHGDSIGYANTPRPMMEDRATGSMHWRARQTVLGTGQDTKDRDRCRLCCSPAVAVPPDRSGLPGGGAVCATVATK